MAAQILSGIEVAQQIRQELVGEVAELKAKGVTPGLAVVLVGEDPASQSYVEMKGKACQELGLHSETIKLPAETKQEELLTIIDRLNLDKRVHGILVQLPLPPQIGENQVLLRIDPDKDVDGFHPMNVGKMLIGEPGFLPCTPHGVQEMLVRTGHSPEGKHVVVVGRSNIVGKPMAAILIQKKKGANATVTVCHSRTNDLPSITRTADILIAAIGVPHFIKADMVKEGAVVIDVGSNRVDDPTAKRGYKWVGDVDFESIKEKASAITPVPGGVGPMTRIMLMKNTVLSAEKHLEKGR